MFTHYYIMPVIPNKDYGHSYIAIKPLSYYMHKTQFLTHISLLNLNRLYAIIEQLVCFCNKDVAHYFELQNLPRTLSIYEINKRRSLQTLKKEYPSSLLSLINQYIRSPMQQILWLKKIVILLHTIGAYPPHNMCGAFAHNMLSIKMYGEDL